MRLEITVFFILTFIPSIIHLRSIPQNQLERLCEQQKTSVCLYNVSVLQNIIEDTNMSGPIKRTGRPRAGSKESPYDLRSKTAPQEASPIVSSTLTRSPSRSLSTRAAMEMTPEGSDSRGQCVNIGLDCHLSPQSGPVPPAGEVVLPPALAAPVVGAAGVASDPSLALAPATPGENQADRTAKFYQLMLAQGIQDPQAHMTEQSLAGHEPSPPPAPQDSDDPSLGAACTSLLVDITGEQPSTKLAPALKCKLPPLIIEPTLEAGHPVLSLDLKQNDDPASLSPLPPLPDTSSSGGSPLSIPMDTDDARSITPPPMDTTPPLVIAPPLDLPPSPPTNVHVPLVPDPNPRGAIELYPGARSRYRGAQLNRNQDVSKIGDHSVHGSGVYEALLHTQAPLGHSEANYIRTLWARIRDADAQFAFAHQSITITSHIHPSAPGGGLEQAAAVWNRVLWFHQAPIAQADRRTLDIRWSEGFQDSALPMSEIMKFYVGGTISERAVTSAIVPKLQPNNANTVRNLANYLVESIYSNNNFGMYAKLLWHAFVRDEYTYAGIQPQATVFGGENQVAFVNLDDPNLNFMDIVVPIIRGDIIMVDRVDYDPNDLLAVHYLSRAGRRYDSAIADAIPHSAYVRWPSLRVTILMHGPAPQPPAAAVLSSEQLIAFAIKLAQQRNELKFLTEGLYWVMDHAGVRYNVVQGQPQAQYILPDFRITDITVPQPSDYNVLLRLAGVRPLFQEADGLEVQQFSMIRSQDRVRLIALYTAAYSIFATTILHSLQIPGSALREWYAANVVPPSSMLMLQRLNNVGAHTSAGAEAPIFNMIKDCFPKFLNVDVVRNTHKGQMWLGGYGSRPDFVAAFDDVPNATTPRLFNPLIIDDFISCRPREWGLVGPCPKVDLSKEVVLQVQENMQGWRALQGSSDYQTTASGRMPFAYVEYGAFAVNVITQYLRPQAQLLSVQSAYHVPLGHAEFTPPAPLAGPVYLEQLHSFMPCTIMTWDAANTSVLAVAIVGPNVGHHDLLALRNLTGTELQSAGLALSMLNHGGAPYATPPIFELPNIFGGAPVSAAPAPADPEQPGNA